MPLEVNPSSSLQLSLLVRILTGIYRIVLASAARQEGESRRRKQFIRVTVISRIYLLLNLSVTYSGNVP